MKYQHVLAAFYRTVWAILPEKLWEIRAFLHLKADGGNVPDEEIRAIAGSRRASGVQTVGRIAVVPIMGVLAQRVGPLEESSGGISTERIGAVLDQLAA